MVTEVHLEQSSSISVRNYQLHQSQLFMTYEYDLCLQKKNTKKPTILACLATSLQLFRARVGVVNQ